MTGRRGVYPGSFNPPTTAHLAIAEAARDQRELDRIDLAISRVALAKETVERPLLDHRLEVIRSALEHHDWLEVVVTDAQLVADLADGYDVVIMGADKWYQVNDPAFYDDDPVARDAAVARLPDLAISPRAGLDIPAEHSLAIAADHHRTSSSAARSGRHDLMLPAAADFDRRTGAWTEPDRYERFLRDNR